MSIFLALFAFYSFEGAFDHAKDGLESDEVFVLFLVANR